MYCKCNCHGYLTIAQFGVMITIHKKYYRIAGLFSGLQFLLFKFSLDLILVVYKIFVYIYYTKIKFSGINFSGFEPARKLIPHEINQLYNIMIIIGKNVHIRLKVYFSKAYQFCDL